MTERALRSSSKLGAIVLLLGAAACAVSKSEFQLASDRASAAYGRGQYLEAEQRWAEAGRIAPSERDRIEARYRAASSVERAGETARARDMLLAIAKEFRVSERAPRALIDAAELEVKLDQRDAAAAHFIECTRRYPDSGLADVGARRWLDLVSDSQETRLARLDELLAERAWPAALDERFLYERAAVLESLGRLDDAIVAYRAVATRHPYPFGAYWDDSLLHAAALERRAGRYREAIESIDRLLAEREGAELNGTNERYQFAPAQFEKAEILRDDLRDSKGARNAFRAVFQHFETSRLRDDALWEEAKLAAGEGADTCEPLRLLVKNLPDSRYARCAGLLCPALSAESAALGRCASYIERDLGQNGEASTKPQ
jgi:outer membrane protein assembly factor BamD (BamD/ComL family)